MTDVLALRGVTKRYGRITALEDLTFSLPAGVIVALLGPNGAGKTTTFKCTLGITDFTGEIEVTGLNVKRRGKEVRSRIGYLPQAPAFFGDDTCEQALTFLAGIRRVPRDRIGELLERVNLAEQRHMRADQLSGGMRQRLALAAALLSDPPVLFLDEPTANLDFDSRHQFHDLLGSLRDEGKTIVLSTHFVEHIAALADRVILLHDGHLVLDKEMKDLAPGGGQYTVHLNGTAPAEFVEALQRIGIAPERLTPGGPGLELAIAKALRDHEQEGEARP
jgi:ABC-type multidrug transport system ATPase subunit